MVEEKKIPGMARKEDGELMVNGGGTKLIA